VERAPERPRVYKFSNMQTARLISGGITSNLKVSSVLSSGVFVVGELSIGELPGHGLRPILAAPATAIQPSLRLLAVLEDAIAEEL
jgi:hypothetical protein